MTQINKTVQTLIKTANDLKKTIQTQLTEAESKLDLTNKPQPSLDELPAPSVTLILQLTETLYQLSNHAKTLIEQQHFLLEAISTLEGRCLQPCQIAEQQMMHASLGSYYIELYLIKGNLQFLNIAKNFLKPLVSIIKVDAPTNTPKQLMPLIGMIKITALRKEMALCQFYSKKLAHLLAKSALTLDVKKSIFTDIDALTAYQHEDWYQQVMLLID